MAVQRELAEQRPDRYRVSLAEALNNLGVSLSRAGQHDAALDAASEAVTLLRELVEEQPDVSQLELAVSLINRCNRLIDMERMTKALDDSAESVAILRTLARERPTFLSLLAVELGVHGVVLYELGEVQEARHVIVEAIDVLWPYFEQAPSSFAQHMRDLLARYTRSLDGTLPSGAMRTRFRHFAELTRAASDQQP